MGSSVGHYLAQVVSWDFEVSDDDPVVTLELLPVRPSGVLPSSLGEPEAPVAGH